VSLTVRVARSLNVALSSMEQDAAAPPELLSVARPLLDGTTMATWIDADPRPTIREIRVACGQIGAGSGLAASLEQLGADVASYEDSPCPPSILARAELLLSGIPDCGPAERLRSRLRYPTSSIPGIVSSLHEVAVLAIAAAALVRDDEARLRG
jgi:hypothetical protein